MSSSLDWPVIARCIAERVAELNMSQHELAERSHVSQAIIRELQYNTVQRNRSARTLEALSVALQLHPDHLSLLLMGRTPPLPDDSPEEDPVTARLAAVERRLTEIADALQEFRIDLAIILHNTRRD
ncbi:transcriptional regulator with XRE-family HTH domain [Actinokineospora baliensis]|uniref:helix-turn-helix domain-containing protein n=1 Tax=Actinokineospora baliensis TaxID=547056 RepID=UPI00195DA8E6|nr:helix-turn-helix transcriptional regulator [Actinokineospora baliensis]MBM7774314.1 transcriptional regulator with XRE-family HTH domain [Actinokineospora baliensis]